MNPIFSENTVERFTENQRFRGGTRWNGAERSLYKAKSMGHSFRPFHRKPLFFEFLFETHSQKGGAFHRKRPIPIVTNKKKFPLRMKRY